jgi:hypothetical protein
VNDIITDLTDDDITTTLHPTSVVAQQDEDAADGDEDAVDADEDAADADEDTTDSQDADGTDT